MLGSPNTHGIKCKIKTLRFHYVVLKFPFSGMNDALLLTFLVFICSGPTGDHTTGTGFFLYIDSSRQQLLDRARLAHGNLFPAGRGVCTLRFYYNMYGSKNMGYLKVFMLFSGYSRWVEAWKTRGVFLASYH